MKKNKILHLFESNGGINRDSTMKRLKTSNVCFWVKMKAFIPVKVKALTSVFNWFANPIDNVAKPI